MANIKVFSKVGQRSRIVTLTFNLLTPKSIGVFLSLSSICVWSIKFVDWSIFELSHYNKVWTDRRTDRQTDGQTDRVITIGLPHLRWRGSNKIPLSINCRCCMIYISGAIKKTVFTVYISNAIIVAILKTPDIHSVNDFALPPISAFRCFASWVNQHQRHHSDD